MLIQAKDELPHGAFLRLVHEKLPFSPRTAQRLMRIARHKALNATDVSHLPTAVTTLCTLCTLPDDVFENCVADGRINPDMDLEDAMRLKRAKVIERDERRTRWNHYVQSIGGVRAAEDLRAEYGNWEQIEIKSPALKSLRKGFDAIEPLLTKAGWQRREGSRDDD